MRKGFHPDAAAARKIHLVLLALAVLIVFGNTLFNGFVYDDNIFTIGNPIYRDFDLGRIFFAMANRVEYLPLRDLTYALDYAVWGESAFGFHFTNLLLYLGNVVVVYFLAERIHLLLSSGGKEESAGAPRNVAFFTALLFAVHTVHSEPVSWVTGRNVLLSGLFFFLSCLMYLRYLEEGEGRKSWPGYAAALLFFVCGLLSKATVITLPLVLLLCALYARRRTPQLTLRSCLVPLAPFFAVSGAFYLIFRSIGVNAHVLTDRMLSFSLDSITAKAATAVQIPFFYLGKLVYPGSFSAEYATGFTQSLSAPAALAALAGLALVVAFLVALRKRFPVLVFGLCWFAAALLPVLNFFQTSPVVADRYVYLASFGLFYCAAALPFCLPQAAWRRMALVTGVVLLVCYGSASGIRNTFWKSNLTLWTETLKNSPKLWKAYLNLGDVYFRQGDYERSFALLQELKGLYPPKDFYHLYQAKLERKRGHLQEAAGAYQSALVYNPDDIEALSGLGLVYDQKGDRVQAIEYFNRVLASPDVDIFGDREIAARKRQAILADYAPRLEALRRRVAAEPSNIPARGELALQLDTLGYGEEALTNYLAMEKQLQDWRLPFNIAAIYQRQGDFGPAARYYGKSLALNDRNPDALNNAGVCLRQLKQYDGAIASFERALAIEPRFQKAMLNLAITYLEMKDNAKALHYFTATREQFPESADRVEPYLKELQKQP